MLNLKALSRSYDRDVRSYSELLPWLTEVSPGIIGNTDGSLMVAFEYEGVALESSGEEDLDVAGMAVEAGLGEFDDHHIMWSFLDKRRTRYVGDSTIANPVARVVDQAWRDHVDNGNLRVVRHVIFISYQAFGGSGGFFDEVSVRIAEGGENLVKASVRVLLERVRRKSTLERVMGQLDGAITRFEEQVRRFSDTLSGRLNIKRLVGPALKAELSNRANVASPRSTVSSPDSVHYLQSLLATDALFREGNGVLRFEGSAATKYVQMHSVKGYPGVANSETVEQMLSMPFDFTLVQMFRFLEREAAKAMVQDYAAHYKSSVKSPIVQLVERITSKESDRVNTGALELANDAQAALHEATVKQVNFGYHTMAFQLIADSVSELNDAAQSLYGLMSNWGYGLVRENINAISAFCTTLPGASSAVTRTSMISTTNLADLTLVRTLRAGENRNRFLSTEMRTAHEALTIVPTSTDVPEMLNLHVGDVGHFLIVGPAGNGKSTMVNFLLFQWMRYAPCRAIILDKDRSSRIAVLALGGSYVDLKKDVNSVQLNPAKWLKDSADWPRLRKWLAVALTAFDPSPLSPEEVRMVDKAISLAAQVVDDGEPATLSLIYTHITSQSKDLQHRFVHWTRHSDRYGEIFDNEVDQFTITDITGIDLGGLLADPHVAPALLVYLFEVIDQAVDGTQPVFLYLGEAWYLLRNPLFREMFEDYVRTFRKRLGVIGLDTQSLQDLVDIPIGPVLQDNLRTRFFLPNISAQAHSHVYQKEFNLGQYEVDIIRMMLPKQHYYLAQDNHRRLLTPRFPPEILALLRSEPSAQSAFDRARASGDPDWLNLYVKEVTRHG
jgi:type IV secretion system protein VirB4